jgi:hypothetical protein
MFSPQPIAGVPESPEGRRPGALSTNRTQGQPPVCGVPESEKACGSGLRPTPWSRNHWLLDRCGCFRPSRSLPSLRLHRLGSLINDSRAHLRRAERHREPSAATQPSRTRTSAWRSTHCPFRQGMRQSGCSMPLVEQIRSPGQALAGDAASAAADELRECRRALGRDACSLARATLQPNSGDCKDPASKSRKARHRRRRRSPSRWATSINLSAECCIREMRQSGTCRDTLPLRNATSYADRRGTAAPLPGRCRSLAPLTDRPVPPLARARALASTKEQCGRRPRDCRRWCDPAAPHASESAGPDYSFHAARGRGQTPPFATVAITWTPSAWSSAVTSARSTRSSERSR